VTTYSSDSPELIIHDDIVVEEITHLPPYKPQVQSYPGFGKSLREAVVWRQSTRTLPPEDRLLERMEDQLVRWNAPQSAFRVDDILNGKHAFQKAELPLLEVLTSVTQQSITEIGAESILKTRMVQNIPNFLRASSSKMIFVENDDEILISPQLGPILETKSIQDDDVFISEFIQPESASVNSSILLKINGLSQQGIETALAEELSPKTVDAIPIDDNDLATIIKDLPAVQEEMRLQREQLDQVQNPPQSTLLEEFAHQCSDVWLDAWNCITCNCDYIDDDARHFYLTRA
jgi:hypothetical protein